MRRTLLIPLSFFLVVQAAFYGCHVVSKPLRFNEGPDPNMTPRERKLEIEITGVSGLCATS